MSLTQEEKRAIEVRLNWFEVQLKYANTKYEKKYLIDEIQYMEKILSN